MTRTEIISLGKIGQHSRYLVRLKNDAQDEYYVIIYSETIDVFNKPNELIKDKKIIKFVTDELIDYLSNSVDITNNVIESIEKNVKQLKINRVTLREIMRK